MKKKNLLLLALISGLTYIVFSSHSAGPAATATIDCTSGSTGCGGASCHGMAPSDSMYSFPQVMTPGGTVVTEYTPGAMYIIRFKGQNLSYSVLPNFGYQFSVVKVGTSLSAGTFMTMSGIHNTLIGTVRVSEQNSPLPSLGTGGYGSNYQVDIPWIAPSPGTGTLELRGIMNLVNNSGTAEAADHWPSGTHFYLPEGPMPTISGSSSICDGDSTTLTAYAPGGTGTWSSSDPSIATVSSAGKVVGVNPGTVMINYSTSVTSVATIIYVNPNPVAIVGIPVVCQEGTTTLTDATSGGVWVSSNTSIASIGSLTGIAHSATASTGTATITYMIPSTSCYTTVPFTVATPPSLTGTSGMCAGTSSPFTHPFPGGVWYSSNPGAATVSTAGMVTGVAAGTSVISYSLSTTGCDAQKTLTVNTMPTASISGAPTVCRNYTTTLSGSPAGGTWSSSDASKATVNSAGVVTGIGNGSAIIKYKVSGTCGDDSTNMAMTISSTGLCTNGVANPFAQKDDLQLYPNPNNGSFSLNILAAVDENAHIEVTNIVGARVHEFNIRTNEVNNITLSQSPGIYFLSVTTMSHKYTVKVVVE